SRIGGILLLVGIAFGTELFVELLGILGPDRAPLLKTLRFIGNSAYREEVRQLRKKQSK
ncbi:undecaprenyl/decaprenyl-phosphate alpha-N-acetylglucosaminyl 1-phosphate transferase, partial [Streptococcus danieliae]|nr:undecaprenyl/decaprenyl-phosphate alpha-N-acetylglucosaminyl 1-phosphate transferase [Streptococcus danieliae]